MVTSVLTSGHSAQSSLLLQPSLHLPHNAIIITFILPKCFENSVNCNCLTTFCDGCKFCLQNISIFATLIFAPEVLVQGWAHWSYCSDVHLSGSGEESLVSEPVLSECFPTELNSSLSPTFSLMSLAFRYSERF